jgi:hypothetical protein
VAKRVGGGLSGDTLGAPLVQASTTNKSTLSTSPTTSPTLSSGLGAYTYFSRELLSVILFAACFVDV